MCLVSRHSARPFSVVNMMICKPQFRRQSRKHSANLLHLECCAADAQGVVLQAEDCVVKQVQVEKDALLAQVRGQMSDMQRQHDHMAAELQRKLTW